MELDQELSCSRIKAWLFIQDLVEGLRDELKLRDTLADEGSLQERLQQDAVPELVKQRVTDLIESSAEVTFFTAIPSMYRAHDNADHQQHFHELLLCCWAYMLLVRVINTNEHEFVLQVFHIVATVAAHTRRQPPSSNLGMSPPLAPATPDQSDACSTTSSTCHSRQASLHGSYGASSSASGGHDPERACSFESNSSVQRSPLPARTRLLRGSSTSSFDGLSTASITSSPLVNKEVSHFLCLCVVLTFMGCARLIKLHVLRRILLYSREQNVAGSFFG